MKTIKLLCACCVVLLLVGCSTEKWLGKEKNTPPVVEVPIQPVPKNLVHEVAHRGEMLSIISKWYTGKVSNWHKLQKANPSLNPKRISIGERILIPEALLIKRDPLPKRYIAKFYLQDANKGKNKTKKNKAKEHKTKNEIQKNASNKKILSTSKAKGVISDDANDEDANKSIEELLADVEKEELKNPPIPKPPSLIEDVPTTKVVIDTEEIEERKKIDVSIKESISLKKSIPTAQANENSIEDKPITDMDRDQLLEELLSE